MGKTGHSYRMSPGLLKKFLSKNHDLKPPVTISAAKQFIVRLLLLSLSASLLLVLTLLYFCITSENDEKVHPCIVSLPFDNLPDGRADKNFDEKKIIEDVETALQALVDGLEQNNAKKIFSIFSPRKSARYIRSGAIHTKVHDIEKLYAESFTALKYMFDRKFIFTEKYYDVLNNNAVLFTGLGSIKNNKYIPDNAPWVIAYTIMWVRESDDWKAINMHISWEHCPRLDNGNCEK